MVGQLVSVLYPQTEAYWFEFYGNVAISGVPARMENEFKALNKWYDIFAFRIGGSESRKVGALFRDITEHKKTEEALKRSEALYRAIAKHLPNAGVYVFDQDLRFLIVEGPGLALPIGFADKKSVEGKTVWDLDKQTREIVEPRYRRVLAGESFHYETNYHGRIIRTDYVPIFNEEGKVVLGMAVPVDITESKMAEEALRQSEEKYRNIVETAQEGIWLIDQNDRTVFVNQKMSDMLGFSIDEILGQSPQKFMAPEFRIKAEDRLIKHIQGTKHVIDYRFIRKDGSNLWCILSSTPLFDDQGKYSGSLAMITDITERKKAEEALRRSEEEYRTLFNTIDEGLSVLELIYDDSGKPVDMRWVEGNPAFEKITGLKNVAGRLCSDFVPSEDYWLETYDRVIKTGESIRYENYHAGIKQWYRTHTSRIGGPENRQVANVFEDITERKRREMNTAFLNEIGKDLSLLSDPDDIIHAVGARIGEFLELSGCYFVEVDEAKNEVTVHHGWSKEDVPSLKQTFNLEDYLTENFIRMARAGEVFIMRDTAQDEQGDAENYARNKVGSFLTVPFLLNGLYKGHIAITTNEPRDWRPDEIELLKEISNLAFPRIERARAEEALHLSELKYRTLSNTLEEKVKERTEELKIAYNSLERIETIRKKEIHHRIKNNLQVISSLLDLQAEKFNNKECIKDSEVLEAFKESQNRVISMALIHEELYRGGEIDSLNFSQYIEELAGNLFLIYRLGSGGIILDMDIEENIFFDMDTSIPLGIIINELVSNSLKHAFSGRDKGEIKIKLYREENKECIESVSEDCKSTNFTLTISDNGVGIPEELDIENLNSLGFQLVISLVDQLDGEFELKRNNGTEFTMRFTVTEKDDLTQVNLKSQECTD